MKLKVLFFEITKKCNAKCEHCGSRCDINEPNGISKEMFMSVLKDVKENIGTDCMLNITGGEPLMRKDLFEIMNYANKLGFSWGMVTNGTLINKETISNMKKSGMSTISISLDGMEEIHESFRKLPKGSFNRIIKNIIALKNANFLEHIQVTFIASKKNIYELPALYRMLCNLKIDSLRISSIDPIGRAEDNKHLMLDENDFKYLIEFIKQSNKTNELKCLWSCSHYFGNDEGPDELGRHFNCITGKNVASILSNGDIFVCPNVPRLPELIQGNISKDKFSDVWKTKFKFFRNRPLNKKCDNCDKKKFCNGDSTHTWDFENNKPKFCYKEMIKQEEKKSVSVDDYFNSLKEKYMSLEFKKIEINNSDKNVIIDINAFEDLKQYFHINQKHPLSMYEQQVALAGFKIDNYYVVKYIIPSILYNRTRNMGFVKYDDIKLIQDEINIIKENIYLSDDKNDFFNKEIEFLGFAHTHPMDTNSHFSDGDITFHKNMYKKNKDFLSLLINPQRNKFLCIYNDFKYANVIIPFTYIKADIN